MNIAYVDLESQYQMYKKEIDKSIEGVINSKKFIMGPEVSDLEEMLADYVGVKHAIACGSGTDALQLALMAYDIQEGDEIIVPSYSFISTAEVVSLFKAKPVFVDVDEKTWNIDPHKIQEVITDRTKGIITVNIFGLCANYDEINTIAKNNHLFVIEDAAQSFGAEYKGQKSCGLGDVGCTSFFPAKILGAYGDGGMVFTESDDIAEKVRSIHIHGCGKDKYDNVCQGVNSRLDTIQAGILMVKFKYLERELDLRLEVVKRYKSFLGEDVERQEFTDDYKHVFCNFCILSSYRDELRVRLEKNAIPSQVYYRKPLHLQMMYYDLGYKEGMLPVTESICERNIALPMHAFLKSEHIEWIGNILSS